MTSAWKWYQKMFIYGRSYQNYRRLIYILNQPRAMMPD
jgi:hypothetical protein